MVVDASVLLEVLLRTPAGLAMEALVFGSGQSLHAPHLVDVEVAQIVRHYAACGDIDGARGRMALTELADLPLRRYPHDLLLPRIWVLRHNFTAYDAAYVALAEVLGATLLTCDRPLAAACAMIGVEVLVPRTGFEPV